MHNVLRVTKNRWTSARLWNSWLKLLPDKILSYRHCDPPSPFLRPSQLEVGSIESYKRTHHLKHWSGNRICSGKKTKKLCFSFFNGTRPAANERGTSTQQQTIKTGTEKREDFSSHWDLQILYVVVWCIIAPTPTPLPAIISSFIFNVFGCQDIFPHQHSVFFLTRGNKSQAGTLHVDHRTELWAGIFLLGVTMELAELKGSTLSRFAAVTEWKWTWDELLLHCSSDEMRLLQPGCHGDKVKVMEPKMVCSRRKWTHQMAGIQLLASCRICNKT